MTLNVGTHLVRAQPTLRLCHGARSQASFSAISLRLPLTSSRIQPYLSPRITSQYRRASTSSSSTSSTTATTLTDPSPSPFSDPLNPPASTRPPPLDLPVRDKSKSLFPHLLQLGKAYLTFYKTGLKAILANRRLLHSLPSSSPSAATSKNGSRDGSGSGSESPLPTRAELLLRARVRHDVARLPLFGLMLLVCGEFTPLVVLLFPHLTPYTCRIPSQIAVLQKAAEARRAASLRAFPPSSPSTAGLEDGHICRRLGIGHAAWDKLGLSVPFARARVADAVARIALDDVLLRSGGGVRLLVDDEVVLACEDRGIDTLGKDVASLRRRLETWVAESAPSKVKAGEDVDADAHERVRRLVLGTRAGI
ncbi:hypothetical protein F5Y14DRAFT_422040 [Nemania sp. NC0429]|nr:hypothetical protein F5Y14DRAFT_422040 [Nemania sp. NC0429]